MKVFLVFTTFVLHLIHFTNTKTPCDRCLDCEACETLTDALFPGCNDNYCGEDTNQNTKCFCVQPFGVSLDECKLMSTEERISINKCYPNWKCKDLTNAPLCSSSGKCGNGLECIRTCCKEDPLRCLQCCDTDIQSQPSVDINPKNSPTVTPSMDCSCDTCLDCSISDPNGYFFPGYESNFCDATANYKCFCVPPPEIPIVYCDYTTPEQRKDFKCYPNLVCEEETTCDPNTGNSCPTGYDCIQTCCDETYKCAKCCEKDETPDPTPRPQPSPTVPPTPRAPLPTPKPQPSPTKPPTPKPNPQTLDCGSTCGVTNDNFKCACVRPEGVSYEECINTEEELRINTCYNNAKCDNPIYNIPCNPTEKDPCKEGFDCVKTCCVSKFEYRCVKCCDNPF